MAETEDNFVWTCVSAVLNLTIFLTFRVLSVMFVTNIRNWYEKNVLAKNLESKPPVADNLKSNLAQKHKKFPNMENLNAKSTPLKKPQNEEANDKNVEESFLLNANQLLDRIKSRKAERDKRLEKVKASLEKITNEKVTKTASKG